MAVPKVTVHGRFLDGDLPAQGTVVFSDPAFSVDSANGTISTPAFVRAYLDQNGEFWASLPINVGVNSTPAPRAYHCDVSVGGSSRTFDFVLNPSLLMVELVDLMEVAEPPVLPPSYVASIGGMSGVITYTEFASVFPTLAPSAGKSAYQLWLDQGHTGTVLDFFNAQRGQQGPVGADGQRGETGPPGPRGARGSAGPVGRAFHVDVIVSTPTSLTAGGGAVSNDGQTTLFPKDTIAAVLSTQEFWYFDGVEWHNLGTYKGETGAPGPSATKQSVGLGNVANLAPKDLPISDVVAEALTNLAANVGQVKTVNGHTGDVQIGADDVGLGDVENYSTANWPYSNALTTKLGQLSDGITAKWTRPTGGNSGTFLRGDNTWRGLGAADVGLGNVRNFPSMAELDAATNLDSLVTSGTWIQASDAAAVLSRSYPVERAGFLQVLANNSGARMVTQTYLAYGYGTSVPTRVYTRSQFNVQPWSPWRQVLVNGIEDLAVQTLRTLSGYGLTAGGSVLGRSLVLGSFTDTVVDSSTSPAVTYPFAPAASVPWTSYPQGMSIWRLAAGVGGSPTDYPLLSGTLINYRHSTWPRQELRTSTGSGWVRSNVNGAWTSWKPIEQEMAAGSVLITPIANDYKTVGVVFPFNRFSAVPVITLTPVTGVPDRVMAGVQNPSATGFDLVLFRTNNTQTSVNWTAIAT